MKELSATVGVERAIIEMFRGALKLTIPAGDRHSVSAGVNDDTLRAIAQVIEMYFAEEHAK